MLLAWTAFLPFLYRASYVSAILTRPPETVNDAARIARGLLVKSSVGTMATLYPDDHPTLSGMPFALQEYYANCYANGSLLLLFLPISRHSQNILNSPSHSASFSIWRTPHPSADHPRVSLMGNVTVFGYGSGSAKNGNGRSISLEQRECYLKAHPDAIRWLPDEPDSPHLSFWARFDPVSVYFVGGFGDEHYIGEIPLHLYQQTDPPYSDGGTGGGDRNDIAKGDRLRVQ